MKTESVDERSSSRPSGQVLSPSMVRGIEGRQASGRLSDAHCVLWARVPISVDGPDAMKRRCLKGALEKRKTKEYTSVQESWGTPKGERTSP